MRGVIFRLLIIFVFALLQIQVLGKVSSFFGLDHAKPDLILILTLYFGLKSGVMSGQTSGFFGGLLEDTVMLSKSFGINMFIMTILGFAAGKFYKKIYIESYLTIFLFIFSATIIKGILMIFIYLVVPDNSFSIANYILDTLIIEVLLNSFIAPLLFGFLNKLNLTIERQI